jgi:hypothetical protein
MKISRDLGAKMFMIIIDPEGDVVLKFDPALIVDRRWRHGLKPLIRHCLRGKRRPRVRVPL